MEINSFFRTKSSDHQGIVYQVIKENKDNYTCIGSRSIGVVDGKIIWELGGYVDDIPINAMHDISNPTPINNTQKIAYIETNKLDKKYNLMNLYSDGYGYWFTIINKEPNRSMSERSNARSISKATRDVSVNSKRANARSNSKRTRSNANARSNSKRTRSNANA
jgi:hypothetical protein